MNLSASAATAAVVVAGATMFALPDAGAAVEDLNVRVGLSNGYGTGCAYTVTALVDGEQPVVFSDSAAADFTPQPAITPTAGSATVNWTPTAPGLHVITATQGASIHRTQVSVGTGISTGSTTCRVI